MSEPETNAVKHGAAHWSAKMLSSGRFAILQYSLLLFCLITVAALWLLIASTDSETRQVANGLIGFATAQISTAFGFYLRGGSE